MKSRDVRSAGCMGAWTALSASAKSFLWVGALVFAGFVLRILRLDYQPLWWDEGWSLYFATAEIPAMIARTAIDIHPPLYYLVLHFWTTIAGSSAMSVRYFSVVVGTLSVALMYPVGRRLFGRVAGIMAVLVMALAPFHVYYSQEARMYGMVALLALASVHTFVLLLDRHQEGASGWKLWALYIALIYMAILTQYYAVFLPLAFSGFMLLRWRRYAGMLGRWFAANGVALALYLPWLYYAGPKLVSYVANKLVKEGDAPVGLWSYFRSHLLAFSVGHPSGAWVTLSWLAVVPLAVAVLAVVILVKDRRHRHHESLSRQDATLFSFIYLILPLSLGYTVNLRYPFSSPSIERLFLLSAPGLFLLVAAGLASLRERWRLPWAAPILLLAVVDIPLLMGLYTAERYRGDDYRPVVDTIQALARPDDVIVAVHPWQLGYFHAYYQGEMPSLYLTPKEATDVTSEVWVDDRDLMEQDLDDLLTDHRLLWLPTHQALGRIIEEDMEAYLFDHYYPVLNRWQGDATRLTGFTGSASQHTVEGGTDFGGSVSLTDYALSSFPVEAAWGVVRVDLRWRIERQLPSRYQMVFRLVDEQGRVWAAEDREPLGGLRPFHEQPMGSEIWDRQGLLVPAGTPPGSYDLKLGLYRVDTGEWLELRDQDGSAQGVEMVLGPAEVRVADAPPPENALAVQRHRAVDFACGVRLLGFSVGSGGFRPGDAVELSLFWKATEDVQEDCTLSLRLQDQEGQIWAQVEGPLATSAYPTSEWARGQLARGIHRLMIPAGVPPGRYHLVISLQRAADGRAVPIRHGVASWGYEHVLGWVEVQGRVHQTTPPAAIRYSTSARLGDSVELLGYDLDKLEVMAGESLHLTLYWHALQEVETSYSVFNHLIDGEERIWGQKDGVPGEGALPTSGWIAGEYITDEYVIPVEADAPPGEYFIETGMYDPLTMRRLPIFDGEGAPDGDRVLLTATPIQVR